MEDRKQFLLSFAEKEGFDPWLWRLSDWRFRVRKFRAQGVKVLFPPSMVD